jgi:hypothetical protein
LKFRSNGTPIAVFAKPPEAVRLNFDESLPKKNCVRKVYIAFIHNFLIASLAKHPSWV